MGAHIEVRTYDPAKLAAMDAYKKFHSEVDKVREAFRLSCENAKYMDGNGPSNGSISQFSDMYPKRLSTPFATFDDAEDWIGDNHQKGHTAFAVKYYGDADDNKSSKVLKAEADVKKTFQQANEVGRIIRTDMRNHKSKLISCKHCGSKINRQYLTYQGHYYVPSCLACRGDILLSGQRKKYQKAIDKMEAAREKLAKVARADCKKNGKLFFMVGGLVRE